jgi:16S rRNA (uracil1498-N3)-methyltransferase
VADRFYCPKLPGDGRFRLEGDESRHLGRVRRLGPGDRVEVFDGGGHAVVAEVIAVGGGGAELSIVGPPLADRSAPCRLTLATAVPKGERFDWLVEKATELGVDRLVPIVTERSVVDPRASKLERLRRVVIEASKQCGRNRLMEIEEPAAWARWSLEPRDARTLRRIAHPGGPSPSAWPRLRPGESVIVAIGPEGGFSPEEVEDARRAGWDVIGLGATRLRIETAGLAACAAILALCEGREG